MKNKKLKVLSLDGGGVKGYLSAKILFNIEQYLNQHDNLDLPIGQRFDLIVGTSTGGIIACALSIGKTAKEIFELYETLIPKIFKPVSKWRLKGLFKTKYSSLELKKNLEKILGECTLKDVITPLCVTSVCAESCNPRFHKSDYFTRNLTRLDEKLVDIALATSSATTFFNLASTQHSSNLTDGGIVANNPSLVALIDALELVDNNIDNISLLSVGTGEQCHMPYNIDKLKTSGKIGWISSNLFTWNKKHGSPLIEMILESQSKLAHLQTKFLLKDNYLRINPKLDFEVGLDDVSKLESLKNIADIENDELNNVLKLLM